MSSSTAKVLADTNVWIAYFRGERAKTQEQPAAEVLDRLIGEDRVVLCGVVEMELYQGLKENERDLLEAQFSALEFFESSREDFRRAGHLLGDLRRQGITIPSPDALIAALCLRHDLTLLENDAHFEHIAGLKRFPWRPS
jgi:predicted nucleic acid-binding protein